jgi:hypothetical protein
MIIDRSIEARGGDFASTEGGELVVTSLGTRPCIVFVLFLYKVGKQKSEGPLECQLFCEAAGCPHALEADDPFP